MKSLICWISSWEWRRSKSVGNKHRFIYGHQYHLRCLVGSKMFGLTSWSFLQLVGTSWEQTYFAQVYQSRVFAEVGEVVGQKMMICIRSTCIWTKSVLRSHAAQQTLTRSRLVFLPSRYNHWKWNWKLWTSESPKKWTVLTWFPRAAFDTVITNYVHTSVTYLHEDLMATSVISRKKQRSTISKYPSRGGSSSLDCQRARSSESSPKYQLFSPKRGLLVSVITIFCWYKHPYSPQSGFMRG